MTDRPAPAEFDVHAERYNETLDEFGVDAAYFADQKAGRIAAALANVAAPRILDFGCGVGNVSVSLKSRLPNARIDGFDPSESSLERMDSALSAAGRFTTDLTTLEPGYDLVFLAGVLHHIPPAERPDTFTELLRLIAPAGKLLVFEHNPTNPVTRRVVNSCIFDKDAVLVPPKDCRRLLTDVGFIEVRNDYMTFLPPWLGLFGPLERLLRWCPAGAQYVASARRPWE